MHQGLGGTIKAGTELFGRMIQVDPLCQMFQCTLGEFSGREVPFKFYVEIAERKTFAEQQYIELKQENIQRLEEVKELQRKLESAAIYGNKVNRLGLLARNDLIVAEQRVRELELDNGALLASLEQAMLDHQPVVLPKRQVIALDHLREGGNSNYNIVTDLATCSWNKDQARHFNEIFDMDRNVLVTALVNGYNVEESVTEGVDRLVSEWHASPGTFNSITDVNLLIEQLTEYAEGIKK